jgi:hypothetical protein
VSQLKIGENIKTESQYIAEAFADHYSLISNSSSSVIIPNNDRFTLSEFLNIPSILNSDFKLPIRHLVKVCQSTWNSQTYIQKMLSNFCHSPMSHF